MKHMSKLVFVYGTLKRGYGNNAAYLKSAEFLGEAETPAIYTLYNGGFPIVERNGNTSVKGEVYKISDEHTLRNVYNLEGYSGKRHSPNNWYDTDEIETPFGKAEIFVMDHAGRSTPLPSGVWGYK